MDNCIDANVDMVHVFIPTSEVQRIHTIRKSHEEVVAITGDIISYAREHTDKVLFSAMDATRTGISELIEVYTAAVDAGATAINVPDTVGIATPTSIKAMIEKLRRRSHVLSMSTATTTSAWQLLIRYQLLKQEQTRYR